MSKLKDILEEVEWGVLRAGTVGWGLAIALWFVGSLYAFAGLTRVTEPTSAFVAAIFVGEVFGLGTSNVLRRLAARPSLSKLSVRRILGAKDKEALRARIDAAFKHVRWYLEQHVGETNFQEYVIRLLSEDQTLPQSEVPTSFEGMTQAIGRDLVDRAQRDVAPWHGLERGILRLEDSFDAPNRAIAVRMSLSELYLRARPVYRQKAASVGPKEKAPAVATHPYLVGFLKYVAAPAIVAAVGAYVGRHL